MFADSSLTLINQTLYPALAQHADQWSRDRRAQMNLWVSTSHHDVNAKSQTYLLEVHMKKVDV